MEARNGILYDLLAVDTMKTIIIYYFLCMIATAWFVLWPFLSQFVLSDWVVVIAVFFAASWLILGRFVVENELKWWGLAGSQVKIFAILIVFLMPVLVYIFMVVAPDRFVPLVGLVTFFLTPVAGMILIIKAKRLFRVVILWSLLSWIVIAPIGWLVAATVDNNIMSLAETERTWVSREAEKCTTTALSQRRHPDSFIWSITNVESRQGTLQYYTWMRIPTYAITIPGCNRVPE